jgi:hypothetical protein
MTPQNLYSLAPAGIVALNPLGYLVSSEYNFLLELVATSGMNIYELSTCPAGGLEIAIYGEVWTDAFTYWRLGTVSYENVPVFVFQNAGLYGTQFFTRYITNASQFWKMTPQQISSLIYHSTDPVSITMGMSPASLKTSERFPTITTISPTTDLGDLTTFYGKTITIGQVLRADGITTISPELPGVVPAPINTGQQSQQELPGLEISFAAEQNSPAYQVPSTVPYPVISPLQDLAPQA